MFVSDQLFINSLFNWFCDKQCQRHRLKRALSLLNHILCIWKHILNHHKERQSSVWSGLKRSEGQNWMRLWSISDDGCCSCDTIQPSHFVLPLAVNVGWRGKISNNVDVLSFFHVLFWASENCQWDKMSKMCGITPAYIFLYSQIVIFWIWNSTDVRRHFFMIKVSIFNNRNCSTTQ